MNKEITIPLVPVTGATIVFFVIISSFSFLFHDKAPKPEDLSPPLVENQIIEKGGSYYWESWFNEVKSHES